MSNEFIICGNHIIRKDNIKSISKYIDEVNNYFTIVIYDLQNNSYDQDFDSSDSIMETMNNITHQLNPIDWNHLQEIEGRN